MKIGVINLSKSQIIIGDLKGLFNRGGEQLPKNKEVHNCLANYKKHCSRQEKIAGEGQTDDSTVPGWFFYSPNTSNGNCFFVAVYDQLKKLEIDLMGIQEEVDPHNTLGINLQGLRNFMPGQWANYEEIVNLIRGGNVAVAIFFLECGNGKQEN